MERFFAALDAINAVMLGVPTLLGLLTVGIIFTVWTRFGQWRSLTHGVQLVRGKVPGVSGHGKGALTHFQALSAALSATVGLGNIGGVAIAVSIGGPGAVFWMWVVGIVGMALKTTEVTLAMLFRNTHDVENPHGGTMWVAKKGFAEISPKLATVGALAGAAFTIPLILFGITGGNMFQAWNAAEIARAYFSVPTWISGLVMAVIVGAVILGGIKRIGHFAGVLVPLMCGIYVVASLYVLASNLSEIPGIFALIFRCAFTPSEAGGAFVGAGVGTAFIFGMKRALFSSEAGLGSAPIAHSAVRTPEPVTEGVVAGLEPFIDTIVVCTMTALVILITGVWNRGPVVTWDSPPALVQSTEGQWLPEGLTLPAPSATSLSDGDQVFLVVEDDSGARAKLFGTVSGEPTQRSIAWRGLESPAQVIESGIFADYPGSTLTAKAFDSVHPGLGQWMVTLAVWLFAISTMITWSYYGEQGIVYLAGERWVKPYRLVWCVLIFVTCLGFIRTDVELDTVSTVALGFMLAINLPTMLLLGYKAMHAYRSYFQRLDAGTLGSSRHPHSPADAPD
ncbi:alanine:cation symporter family protein [Sinimarinibacterium sp. CAU 1509]|uniref:alanine/glycine:cation symporter family protein n=1 Tax=Sinimarinibacterium sp. CAU 1509 TaxID=2562283 RepID=UPI0010AC3509|nr:amino acid carrier protein [Sinimarinibacterium sp. CAU 1509]TJY59361.1 alanine:cation symporter family protein [Sinimarinibacterium sp. CAU 1509]